MACRPDFSQHREDPRFDGYRDRVGRLLRGSEEVGFVLVEVEPYAEKVGSHWWSRWGPTCDVLWLWMVVDGQFSDSPVPDEASDAELRDFDANRFKHYGEVLTVRWLDAGESRHLSRAHFAR